MWCWQDNDEEYVHVHPCISSALTAVFSLLKSSLHFNCVGLLLKDQQGSEENCFSMFNTNAKHGCNLSLAILHSFSGTPISAFTVVPW